MKKTKTKSKKETLSESVETNTIDGRDNDAGAHAHELLRSIGQIKLEKIDLTTASSAKAALPMLDSVLKKLSTYRRASKALKTILEEERDSIPTDVEDVN